MRPRFRVRAAAGLAAVLASGCTYLSTPRPAATPPADATARPPTVRSTTAPASPAPAPGPASASTPHTPADLFADADVLDVDALAALVLARNPSLAAMRAAWEAARARPPQARALDDPELAYGFGPWTIGSAEFAYAQRIDLAQRFPWPGTLRARGEAARYEAAAAGDDVAALRLALVEAAREAFFDLYFVDRALAINDGNQDLLREIRDVADVRYAAGLAAKTDPLQAEVELQHLVHRGVMLRRMRSVAVARLNALLSRPPRSFLPPPPDTIAAPTAAPPTARLHEAAIAARPELAALDARIRARRKDVRLAELAFYPNLRAMAVYDSFWQEEQLRPMVGLGIEVPIQIARRKAALGEARARLGEAEARLAAERDTVVLEVTTAADELHEQAHVVRLYTDAIVPAAEESLAAARSGYETDLNDFRTTLVAEKALRLARLGHAEALAGYHKARARLERAVGRPLAGLEEDRS